MQLQISANRNEAIALDKEMIAARKDWLEEKAKLAPLDEEVLRSDAKYFLLATELKTQMEAGKLSYNDPKLQLKAPTTTPQSEKKPVATRIPEAVVAN